MPSVSEMSTVSTERRPCFYLQVAGIPYLFGSVLPPAKTYDLDGEATPYGRNVSIVPGRGMAFERSLNVRENVIECRPVDVVLASYEMGGDPGAGDPGRVFGRLGFVGADGSAELVAGQSIKQTDSVPFDLTFGDDPGAQFDAGDVIHIGREAFLIDSINSTLKTATISARAVLGTRRAHHLYDTKTQVRLIATKPAVYFRGRRAVIYEGTVKDDGTGADWVERWRGFVASEPEISISNAPTVSIKVAPLTALLDQAMGSQAEDLHLSSRAHAFGPRGRYVDFMEVIPAGAIIDAGTDLIDGLYSEGSSEPADASPWHGTGKIPITQAGHQRFSLAWSSALTGTGHPLNIPLKIDFRGEPGPWTYIPTSVPGSISTPNSNITIARYSINIDNPSGAEVRALGAEDNGVRWPLGGGQVVNVKAAHIREVALTTTETLPEILEWPEVLIARINSPGNDAGTAPGFNVSEYKTRFDQAAGFLRLFLDMDRRALIVSSNVPTTPQRGLSAVFSGDAIFEPVVQGDGTGHPWLGHRWRFTVGGNFTAARREPKYRLSPLAFGLEDQDELNQVSVTVEGSRAGEDTSTLVPVKVARAFYQRGEIDLLVDGPVVMPTAGSLFVEAVHPTGGPIAMFEISGAYAVTLADGTALTRLRLSTTNDASNPNPSEVPAFAEYDGEDGIELKTAAVFAPGASIGEVILQLLCSSGGNAVCSSVYDVLPYGAGLVDGTTADASADPLGVEVDRDSFLSIASPIPNAQFRPVWRSGDSVKSVIGGLLRACGHVLDITTNEAGQCRLGAVPLGLPNRAAVVGAISEADISDNPHPRSSTELLKANVFEFKFNYDNSGSAQSTQRVKDAVSIDISGEEKRIGIPLPGVVLSNDFDRVAQLRPIFSRLRYELALPRRVYELGIRAGFGVQARIGGTYSLTHRNLRSASAMGLTAELVRLRSIVQDGWKAAARAKFVYYGQSGSGWGPSGSVVAVPSSVSVTVQANAHSSTTAPGLGGVIDDGDGFEALTAGDGVLVVPAGDMDAAASVTVASVSGVTITFNEAHGLTDPGDGSVFGYVVPMRSATGTVPSAHSVYAYVGGVTVT